MQRTRLRIQSPRSDAADRARQEAARTAHRRTWARPTADGMAIGGALMTPEQATAWAAGLDALERRERLADKAAGIDRTAEHRRYDRPGPWTPPPPAAGWSDDPPF